MVVKSKKPTCRRRLLGDPDGLLCSNPEPHTPGFACMFVTSSVVQANDTEARQEDQA